MGKVEVAVEVGWKRSLFVCRWIGAISFTGACIEGEASGGMTRGGGWYDVTAAGTAPGDFSIFAGSEDC